MSDEEDELAAKPRSDKVTVKLLIDPVQLKKDMSYSLADLDQAIQEQGSLFVHYGVIASKAARQVDDLKLLLEVAEARVYRALRDGFAKTGEKVTEAQLEKAVVSHPKIIAYKKAINEAKQIEATCKTAVEGFRQRRDMLIQSGATAREEMKGEVSIMRRREVEESREALKQRVLDRMKNSAQTDS